MILCCVADGNEVGEGEQVQPVSVVMAGRIPDYAGIDLDQLSEHGVLRCWGFDAELSAMNAGHVPRIGDQR